MVGWIHPSPQCQSLGLRYCENLKTDSCIALRIADPSTNMQQCHSTLYQFLNECYIASRLVTKKWRNMWKYRNLFRTKKIIEIEIWTSKSQSSKWINLLNYEATTCHTPLGLEEDWYILVWAETVLFLPKYHLHRSSRRAVEDLPQVSIGEFPQISAVGAGIGLNSSPRIVNIPPSITCLPRIRSAHLSLIRFDRHLIGLIASLSQKKIYEHQKRRFESDIWLDQSYFLHHVSTRVHPVTNLINVHDPQTALELWILNGMQWYLSQKSQKWKEANPNTRDTGPCSSWLLTHREMVKIFEDLQL